MSKNTPLPDCYKILGLPPTASQDDIEAAYRRCSDYLTKIERVAPSSRQARIQEGRRQLDLAYAILHDPIQRQSYNAAYPDHQTHSTTACTTLEPRSDSQPINPSMSQPISPSWTESLPSLEKSFYNPRSVLKMKSPNPYLGCIIRAFSLLIVIAAPALRILLTQRSPDLFDFSYIASHAAPPTPPPAIALPPPVTEIEILNQAEQIYQQGLTASEAKQWTEAIKLYDQALTLNPHHAQAYFERGWAERQLASSTDLSVFLKHLDQVISDYSKAILVDPNWWMPYNYRADAYFSRAQAEPLRVNRNQWLALAEADYMQALSLDGTQNWIYCSLSQVLVRRGECDFAGINTAQLCGKPGAALTQADAYRCAGQYDIALQVLNSEFASDPDQPRLYWQRGLVYLSQGNYTQADSDFATAIEKWTGKFAPGNLWYNRAAAEYYLGHPDLVKQYIAKGYRYTWIRWGDPYYYLGMVYLDENQVDEACRALQWAEQTLDEGSPLLPLTRQELQILGSQCPGS